MFIRRLQRDGNRFQGGWNQHRMRPVKGMSPYQLYVCGILQNASQGHIGDNYLCLEPVADDVENVGIDFDEPAPEEDADRVMSSIECPLTPDQLTRLQEQFQPLAEFVDGFGIDALGLKNLSCNSG